MKCLSGFVWGSNEECSLLLSTDLKSLRDGLCRYSFNCSIDNRGNPKKL